VDRAGLAGTASITNTTITNGIAFNLRVDNSVGALTLTVTGSTFSNTGRNLPGNQGEDNVLIEMDSTASISTTFENNTFAAARGDHFQVAGVNSGSANITFRGNTLTGGNVNALGQGITLNAATQNPAYDGTFIYDIDGNTINGSILSAITVNLGSSGAAALFEGYVRNNDIGTSGSPLSCSSQGFGIAIDAHGNGTHTSVVSGNTMRQCFDRGMNVLANDGNGVLNLTVTGNDISDMSTDPNGGREAFNLVAGATSTNIFGLVDSHTVCLALGGAGALANTLNGGQFGTGDFRTRQRFNTTVILPGYAGGARDVDAVIAFIITNNTGTAPLTGSGTVEPVTGGGYITGPSCATP
jgi:hypothetical protein